MLNVDEIANAFEPSKLLDAKFEGQSDSSEFEPPKLIQGTTGYYRSYADYNRG